MIKMHRTSLKHHICIHTLRGKKVSIASVVVAAKAFVFSSHFLTIWSGLGGRVAGARFLGSNSRSADASRPDVWCAKLVYVCVRRRCFPTVIKYSFNPTHRFAQEQHVWPKPFNAKKALSLLYILYNTIYIWYGGITATYGSSWELSKLGQMRRYFCVMRQMYYVVYYYISTTTWYTTIEY